MAKVLDTENRWNSLDGVISLPAFSVIREARLVPIVKGDDGMKTNIHM